MITKRENCTVKTGSESETRQLGKELARLLINNDLLVLSGVLGAGKTCLIKGIAEGLGLMPDDVRSPSFTLVNEYDGNVPLYHFDLYRMKDVSELYNIGWDDYMLRDGIMVVEWGERADDYLPEKYIRINIEIMSETERALTIEFD